MKEAKERVVQVFQTLGLSLEDRRFGAIHQDGRSKKTLYEWKNQQESRAAEITCNAFLDWHIEFLTRVLQTLSFEPTRILDIGCDDGAMTCALGLLFPNAEVVGIDQYMISIKHAQKCARKHLSKAPTFIQKDVMEDSLDDLGEFDLVVAKNVFFECMNLQITPYIWRSHDWLDHFNNQNPVHPSLIKVSNLVREKGKVYSTERITNAWGLGIWSKLWCSQGMSLSIGDCDFMTARTNIGSPDKLPFIVFEKGKTQSITFQDGNMLAHIWELAEPVPSTKDEYVEMLKTRLLNGETLVHMDVDAILIEMAKSEPIHGWYMDDYDQDQSIEEIFDSPYGLLCMNKRAELRGAELKLLQETAESYIARVAQNMSYEYEVTAYTSLDEFYAIFEEE